MKTINSYILEKFRINKDTIKNSAEAEKYFFCDDFATNIKLPDWAFDNRKLKIKDGKKNRFWYAVVNYLYLNGGKKREDIIQALKPNSSSKYSEFFSELIKCKVIIKGEGKQKGLQFLNANTRDWKYFIGNSYIS